MTDHAGTALGSPLSINLWGIAGLVIAFGWVLIPSSSAHQITNVHDDVVSMCVKWLVVFVLSGIAFGIQHLRASELGIRGLGWRDALLAFAGAILALMLSGAASRVVGIPSSVSDLRALAGIPLGIRIAVVLTAAICEEFMYRGFGIEELAMVIGNRWLAGLISLVVFTIAHSRLYGFSARLLVPGIVGAVLTGLYLWRRNLPSCMLMHAIMDGIFLILAPAVVHVK